MHRSPAAYPVRLRCFFLSCCIFAAVSLSLFLCSRFCVAVSLPPFLCHRIFAAVSSPCCFPARKSFPLLHVRISPSLPSRFPHILLLRKEWPKRKISYSFGRSRMPEMSPDMAYRHCSPIFPRIGPQTPSEGVAKTQKFPTPSEGVECHECHPTWPTGIAAPFSRVSAR